MRHEDRELEGRTPLPLWAYAYERYFKFWMRMACSTRVTTDEAKDIVQSVVSMLMTNPRLQFNSPEHLRNYVARSVLNKAVQVKKRLDRNISWSDLLEQRFPQVAEPGDGIDDEAALYRRAIRRLSDKDFEIIKLRFFAGLTFGEISQLLHLPVSTLKSREEAALRRIREWIQKRKH